MKNIFLIVASGGHNTKGNYINTIEESFRLEKITDSIGEQTEKSLKKMPRRMPVFNKVRSKHSIIRLAR